MEKIMTPTNNAVRNQQPVPFSKAEAIMNNATNTPPQAINSAPAKVKVGEKKIETKKGVITVNKYKKNPDSKPVRMVAHLA